MTLPPGQYAIDRLPRFGMSQFARRFARDASRISLQISDETEQPISVQDEFGGLPRVELTADFHCVTTWTCRSLRWSGVRFADLFTLLVAPRTRPHGDATFVVLRGQDGYCAALPLDDRLADDVLLADALDGRPLTIAHGAPAAIGGACPLPVQECQAPRSYRILARRPALSVGRLSLHGPPPRARLAGRARGLPGWLLRYLYRPLVRPTIARFRAAMDAFEQGRG